MNAADRYLEKKLAEQEARARGSAESEREEEAGASAGPVVQRMIPCAEAFRRCFQGTFQLSGRASRSEFWWVWLPFWFIFFGVNFLSHEIGSGVFSLVSDLVSYSVMGFVFIMWIVSLMIRRIQDVGLSRWWFLVCLVPMVGWIVLFVIFCMRSEPRSNRFGVVPNVVAKESTT